MHVSLTDSQVLVLAGEKTLSPEPAAVRFTYLCHTIGNSLSFFICCISHFQVFQLGGARFGENALAQSCRAPQGHDQTRCILSIFFIFSFSEPGRTLLLVQTPMPTRVTRMTSLYNTADECKQCEIGGACSLRL